MTTSGTPGTGSTKKDGKTGHGAQAGGQPQGIDGDGCW